MSENGICIAHLNVAWDLCVLYALWPVLLLHIGGCGVIHRKENSDENIREFCIFINNSTMLILSAMIFNGKTLILGNFISAVIIHIC